MGHGVGSTVEGIYWVEVVASSNVFQHSTGLNKEKRRREEIHTPTQSSQPISWHFPCSRIPPALSAFTPQCCGPMVIERGESKRRFGGLTQQWRKPWGTRGSLD